MVGWKEIALLALGGQCHNSCCIGMIIFIICIVLRFVLLGDLPPSALSETSLVQGVVALAAAAVAVSYACL